MRIVRIRKNKELWRKNNQNNKKKRKEKKDILKSEHTKLTCCLRYGSLGRKSYYTPPIKLEFFVCWILTLWKKDEDLEVVKKEDKMDVIDILVFLRRYEG